MGRRREAALPASAVTRKTTGSQARGACASSSLPSPFSAEKFIAKCSIPPCSTTQVPTRHHSPAAIGPASSAPASIEVSRKNNCTAPTEISMISKARVYGAGRACVQVEWRLACAAARICSSVGEVFGLRALRRT